MIANVVTGRVDPDADERVIGERLIPALKQAHGYQGGYWLRQPTGDEVLAVTLWESEEALRAALANPTVREVTAQTSSMFIEGPQMAVYRLVARGEAGGPPGPPVPAGSAAHDRVPRGTEAQGQEGGGIAMATGAIEANAAERNAAIFRRIIEEGFNQGNLAALDGLVASDMREHQSGLRPGLAGLKETISGLRRDFPDLTLSIEDLVADGDKVWARLRSHGIHRAGFFGLPFTGKPISIDVIDLCRFEGGKMVEHWGVPDRFSLLEQLDLLPRPQQPAAAGA